jgi:hypothetical protein
MAADQGKAETINFEKENVQQRLMEMTNGRGPDSCIDAVGCVTEDGLQCDCAPVYAPDAFHSIDSSPCWSRSRRILSRKTRAARPEENRVVLVRQSKRLHLQSGCVPLFIGRIFRRTIDVECDCDCRARISKLMFHSRWNNYNVSCFVLKFRLSAIDYCFVSTVPISSKLRFQHNFDAAVLLIPKLFISCRSLIQIDSMRDYKRWNAEPAVGEL